MEIPGGRGEQPEALWNGKSGGVGAQTVNNPPWGGDGYFLELHNTCQLDMKKTDHNEVFVYRSCYWTLYFVQCSDKIDMT